MRQWPHCTRLHKQHGAGFTWLVTRGCKLSVHSRHTLLMCKSFISLEIYGSKASSAQSILGKDIFSLSVIIRWWLMREEGLSVKELSMGFSFIGF